MDRKSVRNFWRRFLAVGLCIAMVAGFFIDSGVVIHVQAADPVVPPENMGYKFVIENKWYDLVNSGQVCEIGDSGFVTAQLALDNEVGNGTQDWVNDVEIILAEASEENKKVVSAAVVSGSATTFQITAEGPGYATVDGTIRNKRNGGEIRFSLRFMVGLKINKSGKIPKGIQYQPILTTQDTGSDASYPLTFDYPGLQYQIRLKNISKELKVDDSEHIMGYNYDGLALKWSSSDENIFTVDDKTGLITAVGAGIATLTVETDTNPVLKAQVDVLVDLRFGTDVLSGSSIEYSLFPDKEFVIASPAAIHTFYTTSKTPSELTWVVTKQKEGKWIKSDELEFSYPDDSQGKVQVRASKAGTYKIKGYYNYKTKTENHSGEEINFCNASITIKVPLDYGLDSIIMNYGDIYNIIENSNINEANEFNFTVEEGDGIVTVEQGVIKALKYGSADILITPLSDVDSGYVDENGNPLTADGFTIHVEVIDYIALSRTDLPIYVGGTVNLTAKVSDKTRKVYWESSDTKVATVENGLITGVGEGEATITAYQMINGVRKEAICKVHVSKTINTIKVEPKEADIAVGEFLTLKATTSPELENAVLHWVSADPDIVELENPAIEGTVCTVKGVKPGTTSILAVNQDNMVVGSARVTVLESVKGISISETSVTVQKSEGKYQLYAEITPQTATNKTILWESSDTKVATVDQNGLVKFITFGTVTIIAYSEANPEVRAMCNITITSPVAGLTLDDSKITIEVGKSQRLSYKVLPDTAYNKAVNFVCMDTGIASVDSTGLVTGKKPGTTYITLTTKDGSYSKVCTVTVIQSASSIKLDATSLVLNVDETYDLVATLTPKTSTNKSLQWDSNDPSIAKVTSNGKITGVSPGNAIIVVSTSTGLTAYCYVTVNLQVKGLTLNYTQKKVYKGSTFRLLAEINPEDASNKTVTWTTSDSKIATVTKYGTVKGISGGTVLITCKTEEGGFTANCLVTVVERVTSIKLNKNTYKLGLGKKFTLKATITNTAATNQKVKWKSSNTSVCTVNSQGVITGKKLGYATITATATDGSGVEASCEVRVVRQATGLVVNRSALNMVVGDTFRLKTTIRPSNATYKTPTYTSDNTNIAIVDSTGKITAIGAGTCKIKIAARDNSGLAAYCVVIVRPYVSATGLTLSQTEITMGIGATDTVSYALKPNDSTDTVTWSSNNKDVATVGKTSGLIKANASGIATITATTTSGKTASVKVTVVGLNRNSITMVQYSTFNLTVLGGTGTIIWDVDNPAIATVSPNGMITSRSVGTTYVTALVNGARLRCRVVVTEIQ